MFPMRGSFLGPGGSFGIDFLGLNLFMFLTRMKMNRREAKMRGMGGNWSSILKETKVEEGVMSLLEDMSFIV